MELFMDPMMFMAGTSSAFMRPSSRVQPHHRLFAKVEPNRQRIAEESAEVHRRIHLKIIEEFQQGRDPRDYVTSRSHDLTHRPGSAKELPRQVSFETALELCWLVHFNSQLGTSVEMLMVIDFLHQYCHDDVLEVMPIPVIKAVESMSQGRFSEGVQESYREAFRPFMLREHQVSANKLFKRLVNTQQYQRYLLSQLSGAQGMVSTAQDLISRLKRTQDVFEKVSILMMMQAYAGTQPGLQDLQQHNWHTELLSQLTWWMEEGAASQSRAQARSLPGMPAPSCDFLGSLMPCLSLAADQPAALRAMQQQGLADTIGQLLARVNSFMGALMLRQERPVDPVTTDAGLKIIRQLLGSKMLTADQMQRLGSLCSHLLRDDGRRLWMLPGGGVEHTFCSVCGKDYKYGYDPELDDDGYMKACKCRERSRSWSAFIDPLGIKDKLSNLQRDLEKAKSDTAAQAPTTPPRTDHPSARTRVSTAAGGIEHCANCGKAKGSEGVPVLKFCALCHQAAYCSKACQAQHWKASHKKTCTRHQLQK